MYESFQKRYGKNMKRETAARLLNENLQNIFAFSVSNLFDKQDAEDLTNDIICEAILGKDASSDEEKCNLCFYGIK